MRLTRAQHFGLAGLALLALVACERAQPTNRDTQRQPPPTPQASVSATPPPSATASAQRRPLEFPPYLQGPAEPDDHPKVLADTAGICAQLTAGRHSAFGAMAVFTKRWLQLSWLYEQGDREGTCKIAELVRAAAKYPNGSCTAVHVRQFQDLCENLP